MKEARLYVQLNKITEIRVHKNPHWDEALAVMLVLLVLDRDIKITIIDPDKDRDGNQSHILRIGYGGGEFDEHDLKSKDSKITSAWLVAEALGVTHCCAEVLEESARLDRTPTASTRSIASVLKVLHGEIGERHAFDWALVGAKALLLWSESSKPLPGVEVRQELVAEVSTEVWSAFIEEHKGEPQYYEAGKQAWTECEKAHGNKNGHCDVDVIASLITNGSARSWLSTAIKGLFAKEVAFREAVSILEKSERVAIDWARTKTLSNGKEIVVDSGRYFVVFVSSKNRQINSAYRWHKTKNRAHILVQSSDIGVQIQTDHKFQIDLNRFVALLRLAESRKRGQNPNVQDLWGEGVIPGIPEWFFQAEHHSVLNGSLSHPNVPRTGLNQQDIITVLNYSFQGKGKYWEFVKQSSLIKRHSSERHILRNPVLA